ncbi:MAG: Uncharacterized MFS-type transporter [uncultured Rubrobacteraceae bacterium]|uniref:Uncharacterized MFS-type transporter n=1 Tax=uncultured Rubrobacteraceae bacterium TaxID=349277 RepID=A0A6J4RB07_9ACTN|nr:MAG: Uncharacterized MFS-type transporter [uncultured Rubrobacteraceae bacterium]
MANEGGFLSKVVGGRRSLALLCAARFMVVPDFSIVNVALPAIRDELGLSRAGLQWIITGYVLTFGGFLLLGGRVANIYGRRLVFVAGLVLFAAARWPAAWRGRGGTRRGVRRAGPRGPDRAVLPPWKASLLEGGRVPAGDPVTIAGDGRKRGPGRSEGGLILPGHDTRVAGRAPPRIRR